MVISLKIFSKNKNSLFLFLKIVNKICNKKKLKLNFFIKNFQQLKTTKIFTVLKSPHINKTAQEQFQYCLVAQTIKLYTFQFLKLIIILRKLQVEACFDTKVKTHFLVNFYNLKKFKNQVFNINLYNLKMFKNYTQTRFSKKITSKIFLYLKLFDLKGSLNYK